jgi:hypothetical protein
MKAVLIGLILALTPWIAHAAPETFKGLAGEIGYYVSLLVPLLIGLTIVVFSWNTLQSIWKSKEGKVDAGRAQGIAMGILIIFVMVSVWGILAILRNTFL